MKAQDLQASDGQCAPLCSSTITDVSEYLANGQECAQGKKSQSMLIDETPVDRPCHPAKFKPVARLKSSRTSKYRARDYAMGQNLLMGQSGQRAAENAGHSHSYARRMGAKLARSERVRTAMLEIQRNLRPGELGDLSEAALHQELLNLPKGAKNLKARVSVIRTGLEREGRIGGPSELHLHQHATLPPKVQEMLEAKMLEIMGLQKSTEVLDGAVVSEGAASEGQSQENHGGVQGGGSAFGEQDGAAG